MRAGAVLLYLTYLLVCCLAITLPAGVVHTIEHTFWCDASLSAMRSGLCLTIGHAFWCDVSLSTLPAGVLPVYRSFLLDRCHCNQYITSRLQVGWLQVWYYMYRGVIISDMSTNLGHSPTYLHVGSFYSDTCV